MASRNYLPDSRKQPNFIFYGKLARERLWGPVSGTTCWQKWLRTAVQVILLIETDRTEPGHNNVACY